MSADLRVLMTADGVGGVWPYVLHLSRALTAAGVEVDVAVMGPALSAEQQAAAAAQGISIFHGDYRLEWMDDPWDEVDRAGEWLLALERDRRPDVIHLNGFCHGSLPWSAPVVMVGHSCVCSWWRAVHGEEAPARFDEYRRRMAAGLHASAAVLAPSATMLGELERDHGPFADARVIPNGLPAPASSLPRQDAVLSAGRVWDAGKNLETLCAAAPRLTWPVFVAGDNRHPDGGDVGVDGVRYLGRLDPDTMQRWFASASIYALPARYEPFGLSILEAALGGCALVLGDISSLRENWTGAATFVPPDDSRALYSAIQSLIDDGPRRRWLGAAAAIRARRFTVARMAERYLEVYDEVLAGADRSARPPSAQPPAGLAGIA